MRSDADIKRLRLATAARGEGAAEAFEALYNPRRLIPGQRMNYSVPDEADRAALIAYLIQSAVAAP